MNLKTAMKTVLWDKALDFKGEQSSIIMTPPGIKLLYTLGKTFFVGTYKSISIKQNAILGILSKSNNLASHLITFAFLIPWAIRVLVYQSFVFDL